ncbi:copper transporter [Williamsia phyllosphaerae]|uniref:Copper transporter MctB n=1 Tax=Williamsia phyllosphaerae TaxID=885042 RepID=A0ABQ1VAY1_9NOCA|nr:copper transporter [Williamsia phyllosphaerae]GGF44273.1 hypothetical protein GCM10007298_45060 [Williamsia phyllosphaerae]
MISLRQHAISLIAVFLALAVGLALGSGFLGDRVGSSNDDSTVSGLRSENDALSGQVNAADAFNTAVAPRLLDGLLANRSVLLVTVPGASEGDISGVKQVLNQSGARFAGQVGLTDALIGDGSAEKLTSIVDQSIPAGTTLRPELTDSGGRVGDLLGALLQRKGDAAPASDSDIGSGLAALRQGGFITYVDNAVGPAQLAVVITGDKFADDAGARGQVIARFAAALGARGSGTVLAGRTGSAEGGSPIAVLRSDASLSRGVSSVDDVEASTGRIVTALALANAARSRVGAFGTGPGASAIAPTT